MPLQQTTNNNVRQFRRDRLISQLALANKAGVALRTIHSIEHGAPCRMDTQRKILAAFGLSFDDREKVFPSAPQA